MPQQILAVIIPPAQKVSWHGTHLTFGPEQGMFAKWRATDLMWEFGSEEAGWGSEPSEPATRWKR